MKFKSLRVQGSTSLRFKAQTPHFDDSADFMAALTKRLDAVEFVNHLF